MSLTLTGRLVGALVLLAYLFYLSGGALADSAAGVPAVLSEAGAHQSQLAVGALLMLLNSAAVISIGVLVLPVLRSHSERVAHAYLLTRVVEGVLMAVGVVFVLLLIPFSQAEVAGSPALAAIAPVLQEANIYARNMAMIALGLGSVLFCRVLLRARLVPRALAVLGIVGYPLLAAGETLALLGFDVGMAHYAVGGVFEIALGVLLIVKGFPEVARPDGGGGPARREEGRREQARREEARREEGAESQRTAPDRSVVQ